MLTVHEHEHADLSFGEAHQPHDLQTPLAYRLRICVSEGRQPRANRLSKILTAASSKWTAPMAVT